EPLVVQLRRNARTVLRVVRHRVEHVLNARPLSGLQSPMAVDDLPEVPRTFAARGLVRRTEI
ncbi:MAG TPA: hypothetical protein VIR54_28035, partial [Vicinamibacterales bacterium]